MLLLHAPRIDSEPARPNSLRRRGVTTLDLGLIAGSAYRNLVAGGWKTLIVGSIICFGTVLVVVGVSVLRSTIDAMQRNISGSLTGDLGRQPAIFNAGVALRIGI